MATGRVVRVYIRILRKIRNKPTFYLIGKEGGKYLPSKSALYFVLYMWLKE